MFNLLRPRRASDDGFAMITAIMAGAVIAAVATAATIVSIDGLKLGRVDSATGKSLAVAEAAVTRAEAYLHSPNGGPRPLTCSPSCASNPWGNSTTPQSISFSDGSSAKAWIEVQQPFSPPAYRTGTYIVHATGTTADAKASRSVEETVALSTVSFPLGIFTERSADFQGNGSLTNESMFSNDCITYRGYDHLNFTGMDSYYGIPVAPHTTSYITTDNTISCGNPSSGIHATAPTAACNSASWTNGSYTGSLVYDQDGAGGDFTNSANTACKTAPNQYTTKTSKFTYQDLQGYGYRPRGLTSEAYGFLKQQAQSAGTYYTSASAPPTFSASATPHPILYYDLSGGSAGTTVSIGSQLSSYVWANDPSCTLDHPSVVVVVIGGNLTLSSSSGLSGALFAPDGTVTFSGSGNFTGTVFAQKFSSTSNDLLGLNDCYAKNTSPLILDPKPVHFRQVDQPG